MKRTLLQLSFLVGILIFTPLLLAAFQASNPSRQTTILYDGRLGNLPGRQGLTFLALGLHANQSFANGVTTLDSMPTQDDQAGYFIGESIPLDRSAGYEVQFTIQIQEESHKNHHRAGFSVIVLSDDLLGIELGFWNNEIWAQEGGIDQLFTHAEGVVYDTTAGFVTYRLVISEDSYTLIANDAPILSGPLRDYTAFNDAIDPYETPNFLFLGDNTTGAQTKVDIAYVALESEVMVTAVPTPTTTPTVAPTATPTAVPPSILPGWADYWWRRCTSGYPPKLPTETKKALDSTIQRLSTLLDFSLS